MCETNHSYGINKKSVYSTREMKISYILFANLLQAIHSFTLQSPQNNYNGVSTNSGYNQILHNPLEKQQSHHFSSVALHLSANVDTTETEEVKSIQFLFSKYADDSGLMTKDNLRKVPPFDEMLVRQNK